MVSTPDHSKRARAAWNACLASAYRTALACTIVGAATLYGPASFRRYVAFPAFSYVTVVLVVMDATLGDTWRGCWLALCATLQSVGPAILSLWLIGPTRLSKATTSVAVAVAAAVVVLPERTHLVAKRIALGQIVLVYVIGFIDKDHAQAIMHPLHVAASTAVGVAACVLALLLPFPRLATNEVKVACKQYADNAGERLKLYVSAFSTSNAKSALASISKAKCLARTGQKLIQSTKRYQESMQWERIPWINSLNSEDLKPGERLQEIEKHLRGMEIALTSSPSLFLLGSADAQLRNSLTPLENQINLNLKQSTKPWTAVNPLTVPAESISENKVTKFLTSIHTVPSSLQELPSIFFLFCLKLLYGKSQSNPSITLDNKLPENEDRTSSTKPKNVFWSKRFWKADRMIPTLKCSISLGLATMLGLMYSRENGFWAGLPVAISLASAREATFKVANLKAQGTVLGTVYGVLGCFLFERFLIIRFFSLLPWFVFANFLRTSRMYGQAGGISAVIGAVLILGRINFGEPSDFAIARIMETFIGLSCSILVDVALTPVRASTIARHQLNKSLGALHGCLGSFGLRDGKPGFRRSLDKVVGNLNGLSKSIGEAEMEPSFWFMPFHSACYKKLFGSLSKMVDLLQFGSDAIKILAAHHEIMDKLDDDLKLFKDLSNSSVKSLQEIVSGTSLGLPLHKADTSSSDLSKDDLEMGKLATPKSSKVSLGFDEDEIDKIVCSYLEHSREVVDKICGVDDQEEEVKSELILGLSGLGYCMSSLLTETTNIETMIKELIQWENPSCHINLHDILSQIHGFV